MVPNFAKRLRRMARNGLLRAIGITFALIVAGQTQASPFVVLQSLQQQLSQEEIAWIAENPVIRVHNEMDWPPYNFNLERISRHDASRRSRRHAQYCRHARPP